MTTIDIHTGEITIIDTMTEAEARRSVATINAAAATMGAELLKLRDRQGWRVLGYRTWTECLQSEFAYSRKHLYELMRAAPVQERLSPLGYNVNTDQALALNRLPESIQVATYEMAVKRGKPTADRIEAIGATLTEALATGGFVTTADGEQNALESAINSLRAEQEISKRDNRKLIDTTAQVASATDAGVLTLLLTAEEAAAVCGHEYVRIVVYDVKEAA